MENRSRAEPLSCWQESLESWPVLIKSRPSWTNLFDKSFVSIDSSANYAL
jgi:hypothetical protein